MFIVRPQPLKILSRSPWNVEKFPVVFHRVLRKRHSGSDKSTIKLSSQYNMDKNTESLVQKIHVSSIKAVLNVTGGGVSALNWLLSIPGASRTIIDVTIPYSQKASYLLLGSDPVDGYSGKEQSKRLAKVAYEKAAKATEIGDWDFVGLGVACALATDRTKKGIPSMSHPNKKQRFRRSSLLHHYPELRKTQNLHC